MDRAELIQRKEEIRSELARTRARLAAAEAANQSAGTIAELESRMQELMAEEHRLRLLIDRTRV